MRRTQRREVNHMMIKKLLIAGALSGGLVVSAAGAAFATTASASHHVSTARTAAVHHAKAAGETPGESSGESETGPSDGPGGHADPAGNVDHQFSGGEHHRIGPATGPSRPGPPCRVSPCPGTAGPHPCRGPVPWSCAVA